MVEIKQQNFEANKQLYLDEKIKIQKVLGQDITIEHVGSTAIPNMVGKNIIDILVGANNTEKFAKFKILLCDMGYFPSSGSANDIYQFFASREEETGEGDVHIHLVMKGTKRYNDFIVLRDYLLSNEDEAKAYANCKLDILNNITADRKTYRSVKSEYVSKLIERANKAING